MNSGYYAACTGLRAQTQALEVLANDLANLSTSGYRGQLPTFQSLLAGDGRAALNPLNRAINDFDVSGGTRIDVSAGNIQPTGNPLDLAIEGPGFFVIQTQAGTAYTRDGNFQVSPQGQLTTATGDPVLGDQGPITLPSGAVAVGADGTLSVQGAVAGTVRMVEFAPGTALTPLGMSNYSAPDSAASPAKDSYVRQGMLEASNVNPVGAVVNLISIQRHADMLERALSAFYNDFNRIASDELPRV